VWLLITREYLKVAGSSPASGSIPEVPSNGSTHQIFFLVSFANSFLGVVRLARCPISLRESEVLISTIGQGDRDAKTINLFYYKDHFNFELMNEGEGLSNSDWIFPRRRLEPMQHSYISIASLLLAFAALSLPGYNSCGF
jgi:hypothetical protein